MELTFLAEQSSDSEHSSNGHNIDNNVQDAAAGESQLVVEPIKNKQKEKFPKKVIESTLSVLEDFDEFLIGRWGLEDGYIMEKQYDYEADDEHSSANDDFTSSSSDDDRFARESSIKKDPYQLLSLKEQLYMDQFDRTRNTWPPPPPFGHTYDDEVGPADSDWSIEDEYQRFPRIALSSTSVSARSASMSLTDEDEDDVSKAHKRIHKCRKVGGVHVYGEEVADYLMYKHFKDDDGDISVSSVEQAEYLLQHGWDLSHWFQISTTTYFKPSVTMISENLRKYICLAITLQLQHYIFAIIWTYLTFKFFSLDYEDSTYAFYYFGSFMKPVMAYEAAINWYLPILGYLRQADQSQRTLVIIHDLSFFLNLFHLLLMVPCSALNIYVFLTLHDYVEREIFNKDLNYSATCWDQTQIIRGCCGITSPDDWTEVDDSLSVPDSCCHPPNPNCTINGSTTRKNGCFAPDSDEYYALCVFSISVFLLLLSSLYHNLASYTSLKTVRGMLKRMKPKLIYGTPKWVETRHSTAQFNYTLPVPGVENEDIVEQEALLPPEELPSSRQPSAPKIEEQQVIKVTPSVTFKEHKA